MVLLFLQEGEQNMCPPLSETALNTSPGGQIHSSDDQQSNCCSTGCYPGSPLASVQTPGEGGGRGGCRSLQILFMDPGNS